MVLLLVAFALSLNAAPRPLESHCKAGKAAPAHHHGHSAKDTDGAGQCPHCPPVECRRHTVLMSGYLGSIGFGYPAAMGAWAAAPDRPIVAVTGDGGFAQYMAEVTTAVKHGMNITHVMLNNGQLGKISKEQRAGEWEVWQTQLHNPNFAEYAENCGALGIRVSAGEDIEGAVSKALEHDGPAMVEVMTDAELV